MIMLDWLLKLFKKTPPKTELAEYVPPWGGCELLIEQLEKRLPEDFNYGCGSIQSLIVVAKTLKDFMGWEECKVVGWNRHTVFVYCGREMETMVTEKVLNYYKTTGVGIQFLTGIAEDNNASN